MKFVEFRDDDLIEEQDPEMEDRDTIKQKKQKQ